MCFFAEIFELVPLSQALVVLGMDHFMRALAEEYPLLGARLERRFPLRCHEGEMAEMAEMATHRRLERAIGNRSPC
jgi:hypothetical protein